jgi:hypothetical protein
VRVTERKPPLRPRDDNGLSDEQWAELLQREQERNWPLRRVRDLEAIPQGRLVVFADEGLL